MDQIVNNLVSKLQSHLFVVKGWSQTWFVIFTIQAILYCVSRESIAFLDVVLFPKSNLEDTNTEVLRSQIRSQCKLPPVTQLLMKMKVVHVEMHCS